MELGPPSQAQRSLSTHVLHPASFLGWRSAAWCSVWLEALRLEALRLTSSSARRAWGHRKRSIQASVDVDFGCLCVLYIILISSRGFVRIDWNIYQGIVQLFIEFGVWFPCVRLSLTIPLQCQGHPPTASEAP